MARTLPVGRACIADEAVVPERSATALSLASCLGDGCFAEEIAEDDRCSNVERPGADAFRRGALNFAARAGRVSRR